MKTEELKNKTSWALRESSLKCRTIFNEPTAIWAIASSRESSRSLLTLQLPHRVTVITGLLLLFKNMAQVLYSSGTAIGEIAH